MGCVRVSACVSLCVAHVCACECLCVCKCVCVCLWAAHVCACVCPVRVQQLSVCDSDGLPPAAVCDDVIKLHTGLCQRLELLPLLSYTRGLCLFALIRHFQHLDVARQHGHAACTAK